MSPCFKKTKKVAISIRKAYSGGTNLTTERGSLIFYDNSLYSVVPDLTPGGLKYCTPSFIFSSVGNSGKQIEVK